MPFGTGVGNTDTFFARLDLTDFHAQLNPEPLFVKSFLGFPGDLFIDCSQKRRQTFKNRDLSTQTPPHRTHFQTNHTRADQPQSFWNGTDSQSTIVGQNGFFVKRHSRQGTRTGAGRHHNLLADKHFFSSPGNLDFIAARGHGFDKRGAAVKEADLVFFEQVQNAVIVLPDHCIFARYHPGNIQTDAVNDDAMILKAMIGLLIMLATL
ncbi:hypothetical protein GALL_533340 [mine drainage metagenome]|uniref:Uncharacterized protein n=1 Tax=mine drainage metagenome TaxID=410659 RepID=A0A1J5PNG0_9ZZZZ